MTYYMQIYKIGLFSHNVHLFNRFSEYPNRDEIPQLMQGFRLINLPSLVGR